MTALTFYGGVREIGGNKVLLEDGDTRLFFDFGTSFGKRYRYFEEYLTPRPGAGLLDILEMELLPPLRGLYREDLVPDEALWSRFHPLPHYRELTVDGVLLSHAHLDHSGYISFLRGDIPVYTTAMTAFIAKAIQDIRQDFEREVCYLSPRASSERYLSIQRQKPYRQRPFALLDTSPLPEEAKQFWNWSPSKRKDMELAGLSSAPRRIGHLNLRHFPVDHSVFGASAFAVETSSGWVAYTGDLRLHGKRAHQTETFIKETAMLHPQVLLCEGTRTGDSRHITEEEVYENALRAAQEARGLIIADFGPRNVERLINFHRIAQEVNRKLVVLTKDAYLLEAMALVSEEVPPLSSDILVFAELRARLNLWEERLFEKHSALLTSASEIQSRPDDFILCFSFWDINDLIDIAPKGGTYIYSSSEAYNEEQEIDLRRLRNWVQHFDMKFVGDPEKEEGLHSSGHASGPELLDLIQRIAPKVLIPIHTLDPSYFVENLKGKGIEICPPEEYETFAFG